ncbi:hypothetical protein MKK69_08060 [Methylobacterium sp. J-026]|uniref:hypothetical protein n=1 Tax=Methylobacterium sp. J-026 TaxID=2836624 RepID=UPI001FB9BF7C|nr:hypothetical protein [Methylobacterium sp. J-026]MCJ2134019.1 hypothetical protein [Methylobacterium sp. J-026]
MDDLSDASARRRVFRGVHRASNPLEDQSDPLRPEHDAHPTPVTDADDPHAGFLQAGRTEFFGEDDAQPGAYPGAGWEPDRDAPPLPYASHGHAHGQDDPTPDLFAQDDGRIAVADGLSAAPVTFLHQRVSHTGRPRHEAAPGARSVPLDPPPGTRDDLSEPALIFSTFEPAPDLTDTLRGDAPPDDAARAPAYLGRPAPPVAEIRHFDPSAEDGHGSAARPIPDIHPASDTPTAYGPFETSSPLSYAHHRNDRGPDDLRRDSDVPLSDGSPGGQGRDLPNLQSAGAEGPAAALRDAVEGARGSGVDGEIGRPKPQETASTNEAGQISETSVREDAAQFRASDEESLHQNDGRPSAKHRGINYKVIAAFTVVIPAAAAVYILYAQYNTLKWPDDIVNAFKSTISDRIRGSSATAIDPPDAPPPASQPGAPSEGQAQPPATPRPPETGPLLKSGSLGIPTLTNDPLPILTGMPPAASTATADTEDRQAATSEGAPIPEARGAEAQPAQGPDSASLAPPGNSEALGGPQADQASPGVRSGSRPASVENTRAVTARPPAPALLPDSRPDAEGQAARAQRSTARHRRSRSASSVDEALNVKAERLLAAGEVLAARTLFQSLVTAGDPRGARGVAQTFDPRTLDKFPASGVRPDQDESARWQAIAARLESRQRRTQGEPQQ